MHGNVISRPDAWQEAAQIHRSEAGYMQFLKPGKESLELDQPDHAEQAAAPTTLSMCKFMLMLDSQSIRNLNLL